MIKKSALQRITTGSEKFDRLLGGGLPVASITDVYGAAGTGKTQFAFQNAVMTCLSQRKQSSRPRVVFVDCAGSFRPERTLEIAQARSQDGSGILEMIYSISVRHVADQILASRRVESEAFFSDCRLLIIDDATTNFVIDFGDKVAERQTELSLYLRDQAVLALSRGVSVLMTNSARFKGEKGEAETTGDLLSEFSLYRMHFARVDRRRLATLMQPELTRQRIEFEIDSKGIS